VTCGRSRFHNYNPCDVLLESEEANEEAKAKLAKDSSDAEEEGSESGKESGDETKDNDEDVVEQDTDSVKESAESTTQTKAVGSTESIEEGGHVARHKRSKVRDAQLRRAVSGHEELACGSTRALEVGNAAQEGVERRLNLLQDGLDGGLGRIARVKGDERLGKRVDLVERGGPE